MCSMGGFNIQSAKTYLLERKITGGKKIRQACKVFIKLWIDRKAGNSAGRSNVRILYKNINFLCGKVAV